MTSANQRIANRSNAAQSTGPKTAEGKAVSRTNALKHGLTSDTVLMDWEREKDLSFLRKMMIQECDAQTFVELEYVKQIVSLMWRARRIAVFEAALLNWMGHWSEEYYDLDEDRKGLNSRQERVQAFHSGLRSSDADGAEEDRGQLILGRLLHEALNSNALAKLSRYETHLLNQMHNALAGLERAQDLRRKSDEARDVAKLNHTLTYGTEPGKTW
ncbi:MAG: hypothetical protein AAGI06_12680 [Pseudomonadota bacterium]